MQIPSYFLCDLGLKLSTYLCISSSSSLTLMMAFCNWCLLLPLLNLDGFTNISSFPSPNILKFVQVIVPLFSALLLKGSGKATIK